MARSTKSKSRPTKAKKPLENLPGRIFSDIEEEYIIYLKEAHTPTLNWQELTDRFNERFPESARSKGGLQVHYSRSLQPGAKRRPRKTASRQTGNETTTSSSSAGDDSQPTLSNNVGQATEGTHSTGSTLPQSSEVGTSGEINDSSSQLIATQVPAASQRKRQRSLDPSLRVSTDNTSAFFRDVDELDRTTRTRRRLDKDRNYVVGSSTEDDKVPASQVDINVPVVTSNSARPKAKPVSLKLKMSTARKEVSKKTPAAKKEVSKKTPGAEKEVSKKTPAAEKESRKSTHATNETAKKKTPASKHKKKVPNRVESFTYVEGGVEYTQMIESSGGPVYMSGANGIFGIDEVRPQDTESKGSDVQQTVAQRTQSKESKKVEPPRLGWEVCIKGHKEWELARLGKMLKLWKNPPPGRVTLYCHKSGSFATRARRYDDPVESLTSGGPLLHHLKIEAADAKKESAAANGVTEAKEANKGPATRKRTRGGANLDDHDEIYQSGPSKKTKTAEDSSKEQITKPSPDSSGATEAGKGAIKKASSPRNRAVQPKGKAPSKVSKTQPKKPAARKAASKLRQMMNACSLSPVPEEVEDANRSGPLSSEHTTEPSNDSSNDSSAAHSKFQDNITAEEGMKGPVDPTVATDEATNDQSQDVANEPADAVATTQDNSSGEGASKNPPAYDQ